MDAKEKILEAAITCFCRDGFHLTTTRKIASEAKVSNGLINYHFQDTTHIFWEVIRYIYGLMTPLVRAEVAEATGIDKIKKVIEANFHLHVDRHPKYYSCILLSYYIATYDEELGKLHQEFYRSSIKTLCKILSEYYKSKNKKTLRPLELLGLAQSIWNEMEGGLLFASVTKDKKHNRMMRSQLDLLEIKLQ